MDIDKLLNTLPCKIKDSAILEALKEFFHSVFEELEDTKEQLQQSKEQLQQSKEQLQRSHEELAKAKAKIQALENELRKLRKLPKRPEFRSNTMEPRDRSRGKKDKAEPTSETKTSFAKREQSEVKISVENVPEGSRFKGYRDFTVQDIDLVAKEITYKLEVWQTPDGRVIRANLPAELNGEHFGPALKAYITSMYAHGVTQPAIHELLEGMGFEISTGKVNDILLDEAEKYSAVSEAILRAGLEEAPFFRADDTGTKHQQKAGYCTHIGGDFFAYYKTTFSKSRENFLKILLQGKKGYVINEAMIWHLFQCGVSDPILNLFEECRGKIYSSQRGFNRLLNSLGIESKKLRRQCLEAALVGYIVDSVLRKDQVFLSDRAGQFALFIHAACWVHMERPLRKVVCSSVLVEEELRQVRDAIWTTYDALKQAAAKQQDKEHVHELYDSLIAIKTTSDEINAVITNFATYRRELLRSLDCPGLPPHNNDSERDIRPVAKRRNLSGSTKSEEGLKFRDGLLSLKQTCFRLGYSFWEYLQLWFRGRPPDLAELVRHRYRTASD
jgi:hypothetical protein